MPKARAAAAHRVGRSATQAVCFFILPSIRSRLVELFLPLPGIKQAFGSEAALRSAVARERLTGPAPRWLGVDFTLRVGGSKPVRCASRKSAGNFTGGQLEFQRRTGIVEVLNGRTWEWLRVL
jgi:hypothetical protein